MITDNRDATTTTRTTATTERTEDIKTTAITTIETHKTEDSTKTTIAIEIQMDKIIKTTEMIRTATTKTTEMIRTATTKTTTGTIPTLSVAEDTVGIRTGIITIAIGIRYVWNCS